MQRYLEICLLVFFVKVVSGADPCTSYRLINEPTRNIYFEPRVTDRLICDRDLPAGWYRFQNGRIPTSCVQRNHCGTSTPIWMEGALPAADGREHPAIACINNGFPFGKHCCQSQLNIRVKNCGSFYVYDLVRAPSCNMAYCAGNQRALVCDIGKVMLAGKCVAQYPKMTNFPVLEGPDLSQDGSKFQFGCKIPYPTSETNAVFKVTWTVNGRLLNDPFGKPLTTTLTGSDRTAYLDGINLYNHMNSNLRCNVTSYFKNSPTVTSDIISSKPFFAGFNVSTTAVTLSEKGPDQEVTVESTVPIPCSSINPRTCELDIQLQASDNTADTSAAGCVYPLRYDAHSKTWKTSFKVKATRDFKDDKDKQELIHFLPLVPADQSQGMFFNSTIPSIQVHTLDVGHETCVCYADPHCLTLDSKDKDPTIGLYTPGDYVMYKSKTRPFEVHIRNWDGCTYHKACICAVIAREGNKIYEVDMCKKRKTQIQPPVLKDLSSGQYTTASSWTSQTNLDTGKDFYMDFPSGAHIRIYADTKRGYLNVYLDAPTDDLQNTEGICGTYDYNTANDYTGRDGLLTNLTDFKNQWRIKPNQSLFDNLPSPSAAYDIGHEYCTCSSGLVDCSKGKGANNPKKGCPGGMKCKAAAPPGVVHRRDTSTAYNDDDHDAHIPIDADIIHGRHSRQVRSWPTPSGITLGQATSECTRSLTSSLLHYRCGHMSNLNIQNRISDCVTDVKFSDSFDFNIGHMDAYDESCKSAVLRNVSNYSIGPGNIPVPPADVTTHYCPNQCSLQGRCNRGSCICNSGWMAADCSLRIGAVPNILRIRGDNMCDKQAHPCQVAYVIAENLYFSPNLTCKHVVVGDNGQPNGRAVVNPADFRSKMEVICPLPNSAVQNGKPFQEFRVSVSTDGEHFSAEDKFIIFDSRCQQCALNETCSLKRNTCLIDGFCYLAGAPNNHTLDKVCDPKTNTHAWTTTRTDYDFYTASPRGCSCLWDDSNFECACCRNNGCQCGEVRMDSCTDCNKVAACADGVRS